MSPLDALSAALWFLQSVLTGLGLNDKYRKVASELQAAVDRINVAKDEILTNTELETLRFTPKW